MRERREWSWAEAAFTTLLIWGTAFGLAFCAACGHPQKVQAISIIDWPGKLAITRDPPECYIPDKPIPPDEPTWPTADEDFYRRQYVHRKDFGLWIEYARDLGTRDDAVVTCLMNMLKEQQ